MEDIVRIRVDDVSPDDKFKLYTMYKNTYEGAGESLWFTYRGATV